MKKAIIIGASSGIGMGLAQLLVKNGYRVGITGRRADLLENLRSEQPDSYIVRIFDVNEIRTIPGHLASLVSQLGGLDLMIISSGTGEINDILDFGIEKNTISTNVSGFTAIADWGYNYFSQQGHGHLAGITSVAGLRGNRMAPAYSATKSYQIVYLEGLRIRSKRSGLPVHITDIRPGFVDTAMAKSEMKFWVSGVGKASLQIYKALQRKKGVVYITRRWSLIGFIMKIMPRMIFDKL
jgi:short-subunit dehydrogenase